MRGLTARLTVTLQETHCHNCHHVERMHSYGDSDIPILNLRTVIAAPLLSQGFRIAAREPCQMNRLATTSVHHPVKYFQMIVQIVAVSICPLTHPSQWRVVTVSNRSS
jgi:hypothetical protein